MKVLHCLPTLGKDGFGVSTVVNDLISCQRSCGFDVGVSTLTQPWTSEKFPYDVIHQHMLWLNHGSHAYQLSKRFDKPLLIAPHGALDPWAMKKSALKKYIAWNLRELKFLQSASCLHATSPFEISYFRDLGIRVPIALIPNGLSTSENLLPTLDASSSLFKTYPILLEKRCLLFLSRITPQKGLANLVDSFKLFSSTTEGHDWILLIVGTDMSGYLDTVKRQVQNLDLVQKVVFIPPLYGFDKQQVFASSDAFILPSLAEGFPMVVLEAMAAGLPILCSTASPWMSLPETNAGWWFPPQIPEMFSALLSMGKLSPSQLTHMGRSARNLVESTYDLMKTHKKLIDLYKWLQYSSPVPDFVQL